MQQINGRNNTMNLKKTVCFTGDSLLNCIRYNAKCQEKLLVTGELEKLKTKKKQETDDRATK